MHLWNEYEGRTIAGSYTLGKLLRSEGRNGFFSTSDNAGSNAVIRITEAHFDEEELLNRWRQVAGIHQDNLIEIERIGKTNFEGVPLTFALMEPNDANLGDVLMERPLTPAETTEVARSVLAALTALHASGMVHEHIEPSNIMAVGEIVKLRSDCVRECIADSEFNTPEGCAELRRRDLRDFGTLLLQCLTLEKEWNPAMSLPEPFKRIIPHALNGTWSLEQITSFFPPAAPKPTAPPPTQPAAAPGAPYAAAGAAAAVPPPSPAPKPVNPNQESFAFAASEPAYAAGRQQDTPAPSFRARNYVEPDASPRFSPRNLWIAGGAVALLLSVVWFLASAKSSQPAAPARQAAAPIVDGPQAHAVPAVAPAKPSAAVPVRPAANLASGSGWYVVAYTYNHQEQAEGKADRLKRKHESLDLHVFSPNGHAPFLVTVGGPMSKAEAAAALRRARHNGMPRDTYIRNY